MNDELLRLESQLCFPLYACAKEVVKQYKPLLDPLGLTYTQYIAMLVLWEYGEVNVKTMGEYLYLDSGTLTPVLKRLEQQGYITRKRSDKDERVLTVKLTKEGRELKDRAQIVPEQMACRMSMSKEDFDQLYLLLYKMLGKLQ
ncbi:MAG: MarR family transcriptional regulator [Lachnospiraceae bacterium]|nr:MarR family transcriptional regulator [Lachnospiraceae bacterium]MDY5741457.1 MarR family transcriptional regulator [Lachnospiraceae bacterium]